MKKITSFLIIFLLVVLYPIRTYSAEILQINNSNSILVGDQNRDLAIKLFCVEINNEDDEKTALNLLKKEFPRGSKVKIKPIGFKENILIAKVFDINVRVRRGENCYPMVPPGKSNAQMVGYVNSES